MLCCVLFWLPSSEYVVDSGSEKTKGFITLFHALGVVFNCAEGLHVVHCVLRIGQAELRASCSC